MFDNPQIDSMFFINKARRYVASYLEISIEQVYVVWFSKTLQNWKAMVSSFIEGSPYFEITYNGDKRQTYIDVYKKHENLSIDD